MRVLIATCLAVTLAGCDAADTVSVVRVEEARVTLPAVRGRPGAGYFTVRAGDRASRIASVTSPRVERIELHNSSMAGGVMRMGPLKDASLAPGTELRFEPGGKHAMLFGIDPALKPGDTVPLTFRFDEAPELTVQADVQGPGGGHAGH